MNVFVQHMGTPATKAHDLGVLTLEQCLRRFVGMNERGWSTFDEAWVTRLCREGGRYAHFYFAPVERRDLAHEADLRWERRAQLRLDCMDE